MTAAVLATAAMFALSGPPPAAQIDVTARLQHQNTARLAPKGRAGDATSSRWIVRDRYGHDIGDALLDCRWVTTSLRLCIGQLAMPLGTLVVVGSSRTAFLGQLAVVGGTGRYAGASGVLLFKQTGTRRYVLSISYRQ